MDRILLDLNQGYRFCQKNNVRCQIKSRLLQLIITRKIIQKGRPFSTARFCALLNNSLLSRIKYSFNENWAVKLDGSYNFSKGDSYIEPTVVWQQNRWEVKAGMGIFSGPKDTFFGRYKDDDRFFMKTTYNF